MLLSKDKRMFSKRGFTAFLFSAFYLWMQGGPFQAGNVLCGNVRQGTEMNQGSPITLVKAQPVYYDNTIQRIIRNDCGRCHSGPSRYLMDYDNLKAYADGGMLGSMVQGPMRRFAGNDVQTILDWIRQGAPEKPAAKAAAFTEGFGANNPVCPTPGTGTGAPHHRAPKGQITYNSTIKAILAKDCLRCHAGPFRNLATYKHVKMYVDNGLLKTLVVPGGPMHRFAGPDTREIVAWINSGAPE